MTQPILGLAGWSGSGKTTLATQLIKGLSARGLKVSTLKHAHHAFDVDQPGKDSFRHRDAGAGQVLVTSTNRWALMSENRSVPELTLAQAVSKLDPCDLVLVEGFKGEDFPKLEVHRPSIGKPLLHPDVPGILAVASDAPLTLNLPVFNLNEVPEIEGWILEWLN